MPAGGGVHPIGLVPGIHGLQHEDPDSPPFVMPGPRIKSGGDPRISLNRTHRTLGKHVDGRVKPGHDEESVWYRGFASRAPYPAT